MANNKTYGDPHDSTRSYIKAAAPAGAENLDRDLAFLWKRLRSDVTWDATWITKIRDLLRNKTKHIDVMACENYHADCLGHVLNGIVIEWNLTIRGNLVGTGASDFEKLPQWALRRMLSIIVGLEQGDTPPEPVDYKTAMTGWVPRRRRRSVFAE